MRVGVSFNRQSSPLGSPQPLMSPGATSNDTVITYSIIFNTFNAFTYGNKKHFTATSANFTTSAI